MLPDEERALCPVCWARVALRREGFPDTRTVELHDDRGGFPCGGTNALLWWPSGIPLAGRPYP